MRARDNPFNTERVLRIRYELPHGDWDGLLARLDALNYRAAIVGPHGAGKTTLLEDLQERLHARSIPTVWLRLDTSTPTFAPGVLDACFARVTPAHVICLDGAEQLTRLAWMSFKRRTRAARGLIITSHGTALLPTLIECRTSAPLLDRIVTRLLSTSPADRPPPVSVPANLPTPDELFLKHRGNLRDALRELYDWYA
jgi:hypothetical protein